MAGCGIVSDADRIILSLRGRIDHSRNPLQTPRLPQAMNGTLRTSESRPAAPQERVWRLITPTLENGCCAIDIIVIQINWKHEPHLPVPFSGERRWQLPFLLRRRWEAMR
jgi:hypothetical protein